MIQEVATGNWIAIRVEPVDAADMRTLGRGWRFIWLDEVKKAAYQQYGFTRVGHSNRMNLGPPATAKLIAKYERRRPNG
jgi:hypothetical protein